MQETATDVYTIPQEHLDFCVTIRQIAREKIAPRSAEIDEQAEYPWDIRKLLAEQDVLGLPFPTEYGGTGTGTLMLNMAVEELAKVDAAVALILMVQELGTLPIQLFGTEEQKERFLPRCASGEWSPAFALSEPEAGSDPAGMQTTAVWDGSAQPGSGEGEWVINGTKNWISNLGVADFYVTFAVTDRESKRITAFVVEADRPGFSVGKLEHKLGIRASPTGQPIFEDVRVPRENVIGEIGRGLRVALTTLEHTRLGAAAQAVGIAQGATDYAVAYARERKQFGRPIGDFQGIEFKLADMEIRTAAARELLYKACAMADQGHPQRAKYSSMAKVFCSDTAMAVTVDAVQVLGGYGYVKEYPVERMMRDAKITQIYEGTNEIQRVVIARTMK
jgi:acyl-CoA dehydrogenase